MTVLQGILAILSLFALFYQWLSVMTLAGLYAYHGSATIKGSLQIMWALCLMTQGFFIVTFVDLGVWWR